MKGVITVVFVIFAAILYGNSMDSIIVECKIFDKETGSRVVAKVKYESLPYGSKLGLRNDSTVNVRLEFDEKYMVRVEAPGFQTERFEIDFAQYAGATHIVKEVRLVKGLMVGALLRLESLNFGQASAVIGPEAHAELDNLVGILNDNPNMVIQLEGHTDPSGDPKLNMKLSKERVDATKNYLVTKGIAKERINVAAFGGERPLSRSNSAEARALNRRVEVRVISN